MKKELINLVLVFSIVTILFSSLITPVSAAEEYIEQKYLAEPLYVNPNSSIRIDWSQAYIENPTIEKYRSQIQYITLIDDYGEIGRYTTYGTSFDLPSLPESDSYYIVFVGGSYEKQNCFAIFKIHVDADTSNDNNGGSFSTTPQQSNISVVVNGKYVKFDVPPQIINNRTMVPIRAIFEALGATVIWKPEKQQVYAEKWYEPTQGIVCAVFEIGSNVMINSFGEMYDYIDTPPMIISGRTLVPVRAAAEAFDYNVHWDESTMTVYIYE